MYLFDIGDFNCDAIPSDWEDYGSTYRSLFNTNIKCLDKSIQSSVIGFSEEIKNKINTLFEDYVDAVNEAKNKLNLLISELSANPTGSTCFNKTLYTDFILSFNVIESILQNINLYLTTGGDFIGYDLNVGVDTSIIYPKSGSTSNKVTKCNSVYTKQMDFGSEFIGKVSVFTPTIDRHNYHEWVQWNGQIYPLWYEPFDWNGLASNPWSDGSIIMYNRS